MLKVVVHHKLAWSKHKHKHIHRHAQTHAHTPMHTCTHTYTHMHAHKTYHYKILKLLSSSFWSLSLVLYQKKKIIPVFKDEIKSLSLELWGWHSQFWRSSSWKERAKLIGSDILPMESQLTERSRWINCLERVISSLDDPEISRSLYCCFYQPSTQNCPEYKSLCWQIVHPTSSVALALFFGSDMMRGLLLTDTCPQSQLGHGTKSSLNCW